MKTSNYIFIGFLLFFFGTITALHIDSKNFEDEYLKLEKEKKAINLLKYDFYNALNTFNNDRTFEKWNVFLEKSKLYFANDIKSRDDFDAVSFGIYWNYKRFDDFQALKLAKNWAKKGVDIKPDDIYMNDAYSSILYDLGEFEEAVKHLAIALNTAKEENHRWEEPYIKRLEEYKNKLKK